MINTKSLSQSWGVWLLLSLLVILQGQLWFSQGGLIQAIHLKQVIKSQRVLKDQLTQSNNQLLSEIHDLEQGEYFLEYYARFHLGMIKENEIFVNTQAIKSQ
jgi:cell division protein FtsB